MKITNKYNLPEVLVKLASYTRRPDQFRLSVSEIINPPLQRYLKWKHWDEIEIDVSDNLWGILGSAVHAALEKVNLENALTEEKLTVQCEEFIIAGRPDLYHNEEVTDWKITSVYSFMRGLKTEWEQQLNLYAWLYQKHGFKVSKLLIHAILRDWTEGKSHEDWYPKIPFQEVEVPIWSNEQIETYLQKRIKLHFSVFSGIQDEHICTPEERWRRSTTYAVIKNGRKSAIRVLSSLEEAEAYMKENKLTFGYSIEERIGSDIRCERYCIISQFCEYKEKSHK